MSQSTYNFYLLYLNNPTSFKIVSLQTNNTLFAALEQEKIKKAKILTKKREQFTLEQLIKFNKSII